MPRLTTRVATPSPVPTPTLSEARPEEEVAANSSLPAPEEGQRRYAPVPEEKREEDKESSATLVAREALPTHHGHPAEPRTEPGIPGNPATSTSEQKPEGGQNSRNDVAREPFDAGESSAPLRSEKPCSRTGERGRGGLPPETHVEPPTVSPLKAEEPGAESSAQQLEEERHGDAATDSRPLRTARDDQLTSSAGTGAAEFSPSRTFHVRPCGWPASLPCAVYRLPRPPSTGGFSDAFSGAVHLTGLAFSEPGKPHNLDGLAAHWAGGILVRRKTGETSLLKAERQFVRLQRRGRAGSSSDEDAAELGEAASPRASFRRGRRPRSAGLVPAPCESFQRDPRGRAPRRRLTRRLSDAASESSSATKHIPWAGVVTKEACRAATGAPAGVGRSVSDAEPRSRTSERSADSEGPNGEVDEDRSNFHADSGAEPGCGRDPAERNGATAVAGREGAGGDSCGESPPTPLVSGDAPPAGFSGITDSSPFPGQSTCSSLHFRVRTVPRTIACSLSAVEEQSQCSSSASQWQGTAFSDNTCESTTTFSFMEDGTAIGGPPLRLPAVPPPLCVPATFLGSSVHASRTRPEAEEAERGAVSSRLCAREAHQEAGVRTGPVRSAPGSVSRVEAGDAHAVADGPREGMSACRVPTKSLAHALSSENEGDRCAPARASRLVAASSLEPKGASEVAPVGAAAFAGAEACAGAVPHSFALFTRHCGTSGKSIDTVRNGEAPDIPEIGSSEQDRGSAAERQSHVSAPCVAAPRRFLKESVLDERQPKGLAGGKLTREEGRAGLPRLLPRIIYDPWNEEIGTSCSSPRSSSLRSTPTDNAFRTGGPGFTFELSRNPDRAGVLSASAPGQLGSAARPWEERAAQPERTAAGSFPGSRRGEQKAGGEQKGRDARARLVMTQAGPEAQTQALPEVFDAGHGDAIVVLGRSTDRRETEGLRASETALPHFAFSRSSLALERDGASEADVDASGETTTASGLAPVQTVDTRLCVETDPRPRARSFVTTRLQSERSVSPKDGSAAVQVEIASASANLPQLLTRSSGAEGGILRGRDASGGAQKEGTKSATDAGETPIEGPGPQGTRPSRRGADSDATTVVPPGAGAPEDQGSRIDTEGSPSSSEDWAQTEQTGEDAQEETGEARGGLYVAPTRNAGDRLPPASAGMNFVLHAELLSSDTESEADTRSPAGRSPGEAPLLEGRHAPWASAGWQRGKRYVEKDPTRLSRFGRSAEVGENRAELEKQALSETDTLTSHRRSCSADSASTEQPLEPPRKNSLASETLSSVQAPALAAFTCPAKDTLPPIPSLPASEAGSAALVFSFSGPDGITCLEAAGVLDPNNKNTACGVSVAPGDRRFSRREATDAVGRSSGEDGSSRPRAEGQAGKEILRKKTDSGESRDFPVFSRLEEEIRPPLPPQPAAAPEPIVQSPWGAFTAVGPLAESGASEGHSPEKRLHPFRAKDVRESSGEASSSARMNLASGPRDGERSSAFAGLPRSSSSSLVTRSGTDSGPSHIPLPALFSSFSGPAEPPQIASSLAASRPSASWGSSAPFGSSLFSSARADPLAKELTSLDQNGEHPLTERGSEHLRDSSLLAFSFSASSPVALAASSSERLLSRETLPAVWKPPPRRPSCFEFRASRRRDAETIWGESGDSGQGGVPACCACGESAVRRGRAAVPRESAERGEICETDELVDTQDLRAMKLRTCWGLVEVTAEGEFCFAFKARSELRDLYSPDASSRKLGKTGTERRAVASPAQVNLSSSASVGSEEFDAEARCSSSVCSSSVCSWSSRTRQPVLARPGENVNEASKRVASRDVEASASEIESAPRAWKPGVELLFVVETGGRLVRVQELGETSAGRVLKRFHVECLSGRQALRYQYACQVVACLKQHTPKVILKNSGIGVFQLMSNTPADFVATFTSTFSLFIASIHIRRGVVCFQTRLGDSLHLPADDVATALTQNPMETRSFASGLTARSESVCVSAKKKAPLSLGCPSLRRAQPPDTQSWSSSSFAGSEDALGCGRGRSHASTACSSHLAGSRAEAPAKKEEKDSAPGGRGTPTSETGAVAFSGPNGGEFSFGPCASSADLSSTASGAGEAKIQRGREAWQEKKRQQWEEVRAALAAAQLPLASVVQAWQVVLRAFAVCCEEERRGLCTYTGKLQKELRQVQSDDGDTRADEASSSGPLAGECGKLERKAEETLDVAQLRRHIYQSVFPITAKRKNQEWV
ncbi:conserved hypothetical protein [Neospora caninum Liverpool]|uniref:Uncharacterized protein n=1 Tax=Neospora caninum (strain Liverpool) TaxID=572307 RepID=F0VRQ9_NEOCL|nr:conserved hypothetical protein [Neospora caninum Liverpool]CBZ56407.1 conserved hypothetical protein [Neospora caninum Liverpool]|eukprot:XP_003886432.1 conserved hypothetical protein [Neospora caninum Liverpool]